MPEYSLEEKTLMAEIMRESDQMFVDIFVGPARVQSGRETLMAEIMRVSD